MTISRATPWHPYPVNFLGWRILEEISRYNHITNDWGDRERLMAVEPRHPETQAHRLWVLERWLVERPATKVVWFTSLFYNFAWFQGDRPERHFVYSDRGSYDFTVNPAALRAFEQAHGYRMTSEDFVNGGLFNATHHVPSALVEWLPSWVAAGGSLVGIGEPSTEPCGRSYFQLSDVLGVDRQTGRPICAMKDAFSPPTGTHFITRDVEGTLDLGKDVDGVYVLDGETTVLAERAGSPTIAVRHYGRGRSMYLSGFVYSLANTRRLHRGIAWCAR